MRANPAKWSLESRQAVYSFLYHAVWGREVLQCKAQAQYDPHMWLPQVQPEPTHLTASLCSDAAACIKHLYRSSVGDTGPLAPGRGRSDCGGSGDAGPIATAPVGGAAFAAPVATALSINALTFTPARLSPPKEPGTVGSKPRTARTPPAG